MGYLPVEMLVSIILDLFDLVANLAIDPATGCWKGSTGPKYCQVAGASDNEEVEEENVEDGQVG